MSIEPSGPQRFVRMNPSAMCWRITHNNLRHIADWCGGSTWGAGVRVPQGRWDYTGAVGDWVVREGNTWRVMSDTDFRAVFVPSPIDVVVIP